MSTRHSAFASLLLGACLAGAGGGAHGGAAMRGTKSTGVQPGEWLSPQGDSARTGRVALPGQTTDPKVAWRLDMAPRDYFVAAEGGKAPATLPLSEALRLKPLTAKQMQTWGMQPAPVDLCGDGKLVAPPLGFGTKIGKFLPDVPGLQRLIIANGWAEESFLQLHSFESGVASPRLVWQAPVKPSYLPLPVVLDVDGDGQREVAVSRWYGVAVYDLATGKEKYASDYRKDYTRPYGFFGAYANPDGRAYMVAAGTFAGYISSLAIRDGQLKVLWSHFYDTGEGQGVYFRQTINTYVPQSLGDLNGDGRGEMLMNLYNGTGDNRWHLLAYDLETGEPSLDLPDIYLRGVADLDGDGRQELLCQHCPARPVGTNGELRVYRWDQLLWTHPYGRWALYPLPMMSLTSESSGDYSGRNDLVRQPGCGPGETVFFTSHSRQGETVRSLTLRPGGRPAGTRCVASETALVTAPANVVLDAAGAAPGKVLVRLHAGRGEATAVKTRGGSLRLEAVARSPQLPPAPLVIRDPRGRPQIVLDDDAEWVRGFAAAEGKTPPRALWRHRGHGVNRPSGPPDHLGLVAGDVDGDGQPEVVLMEETPAGGARFVALGLDGREHWEHVVPEYGGRAPMHNESGIQQWYLGHFRDRRRLDLIYLAEKNMYTSGVMYLVNTATGRQVWSRDRIHCGGPGRRAPFMEMHFTPNMCAFGDLNDDRRDDLIIGWPAFIALKGTNGAQIATDWFGWADRGLMAVTDEIVDGNRLLLYVDPLKTGAYVCDGDAPRAIWELPENEGGSAAAALGDTDGDGQTEAGIPGCADGFRCLDLRTGAVRWTVPLPQAVQRECSNCVCCDINGDGREEFVFAAGPRLIAASPRPGARDNIVWEITLPAAVRSVVVADVDGDGKAEVLCGGTDGVLYCVR